jgi:hypothetical protein
MVTAVAEFNNGADSVVLYLIRPCIVLTTNALIMATRKQGSIQGSIQEIEDYHEQQIWALHFLTPEWIHGTVSDCAARTRTRKQG